jgi:hypothetical protein
MATHGGRRMNREAIDEAILKVKQMMGEVFY